MNEHDLSLLTDEERVDLDSLRNALENDAAQLTREFHKVHLESVEQWVTRLIAARAETSKMADDFRSLVVELLAAQDELRAIREQAIGICIDEKAADSAWMNVLSRSSEALGLPMPDGVSGEANAIARAENKQLKDKLEFEQRREDNVP